MDRKLLIQGIIKFLAGVVLLGVLLFLPAGTLAWSQGWRLMGILFIPMLFAGIVMIRKNPELLRKRLNAKEKQAEQQDVLKLSALMFLAVFILAGLNFRFRWIVLPDWIPRTATVIFLISYGLYAEVMRENAYLSRTIEVQENQKVVDTGLYGLLRLGELLDGHVGLGLCELMGKIVADGDRKHEVTVSKTLHEG